VSKPEAKYFHILVLSGIEHLRCPLCGEVQCIFDTDNPPKSELQLRFLRQGPSIAASVPPELANAIENQPTEAVAQIVYGVLSGLALTAIRELYVQWMKARGRSDYHEFDKAVNKVMEFYGMKFCQFCNRPVRRADIYCDRCGLYLA
jgi:hypothetical protein